MTNDKRPPLDNATLIASMGPRKATARPRFKMGLLGVALLAAMATGAAINNAAQTSPPIQGAQAQVVAKFIMFDGVSLQGKGASAWQQVDDSMIARHNLVLELDGRNAVVSVSPEVFDSVCQHITEDIARKWDGGMGCGTVYGAAGESPSVVIDKLDKIAIDVSINDADGMVVHSLQGAEPLATGLLSRLNLKRDLTTKAKPSTSI